MLKDGTAITGPGSSGINEQRVQGANIRKDGYLEISEGSSLYAQYMPIEGGAKITGEDSVLDVQKATVFGDNAVVTVEDGGTLQLIGADKNTYPYLTIGYGEDKGSLDVNAGGKVVITGATNNAGKQEGSLTINQNGVVKVAGGSLFVDNGAVVKNDGTFKVTGEDASTVKATITGKALQLENGVLENSEITGDVQVYGTKNAISGTADNPTSINTLRLGYSAATVADAEVAITGNISKIGNFIIGQSSSAENFSADTKYTVKIGTADGEKTTVGKSSGGAFQVKANGYVTLDNTDYYYNYTSFGGSVTATNSLLQITNVDNFIIGGGRVELVNSTWNSRPTEGNSYSSLKLGSAYNNVAEGNASLTLKDSSTVDAWHLNILDANGYTVKLDAQSGSKITATMVTVGKDATVSLTGGASIKATGCHGVYSFQEGIVTVNGAITMDGLSTLTADSITLGENASITINATNFAGGIKKIIDLNGSESLEGKVTVNGIDEANVVYGDDGDVTLVKVDTATLYVNSDWSKYNKGDAIPGTEDKLAYGFNAFASSKDALKKANELGGATINLHKDNGTPLGEFSLTNKGTYQITGGTGKDSTLYGTILAADDVKVEFVDAYATIYKIGDKENLKNTSVTVKDSIILSSTYAGAWSGWSTVKSTSFSIENSIYGYSKGTWKDEYREMARSASAVKNDEDYKILVGLVNNQGPHIGTVGDFIVKDSTVIGGSITVADRGYMDLDNSVLYYAGTMVIGPSSNHKPDSNVSGWGGNRTSAEGYRVGEVATMDITDSIVRNVGWGVSGSSSAGNGSNGGFSVQVGGEKGGMLKVTNSDVNLGPIDADGNEISTEYDLLDVKSNGIVDISYNSIFNTAKITNAGEVSVAGSSLDVDTLTNSGEGSVVIKKYEVLDEEGNVTEVIRSNAEFGTVSVPPPRRLKRTTLTASFACAVTWDAVRTAFV